MSSTAQLWKSEKNLQSSVLSFSHVGSEDSTSLVHALLSTELLSLTVGIISFLSFS